MLCEDVKMWKEYVKMFDRPPLLEEPFAQMLSGKKEALVGTFCSFFHQSQVNTLPISHPSQQSGAPYLEKLVRQLVN